MINITTGEVIKSLRKNCELTQDELATILNVNKSSVQKYEGNSVSNLKMNTIRNLCHYFKMPPWVFIFPEHMDNEDELLTMQYKNSMFENVGFAFILNKEGKEKVLDYAQDLIDSEKYLR